MSSLQHVKIPLKVIPEPAPNTRAVFVLKGMFPAIKGQGDIDLVCGKCGQILVEGIGKGITISNIVIRCPKCGSFNEIP